MWIFCRKYFDSKMSFYWIWKCCYIISGTETASAEEIAIYVRDWLSEGPLITFVFHCSWYLVRGWSVFVCWSRVYRLSAATTPVGAAVGGAIAIGAVSSLIVVSIIFALVYFLVFRKRSHLHKSRYLYTWIVLNDELIMYCAGRGLRWVLYKPM